MPLLAKANIPDVLTIDKAWKLLDIDYRNCHEVHPKVNDLVQGMKFKVIEDPANILKLYQPVQVFAAKIKATGNISLTKKYREYAALVNKHLTKEVMWI